jgi:3-phosphoshikimate 1-carboxyvinyltransferase
MSLVGRFSPPGDKSISHRIALFSLLSKGEAHVTNLSPGGDIRSSVEAVAKLGSQLLRKGERLVFRGAGGRFTERAHIDCGNSGTTMRLLMGILSGSAGWFVLNGDRSLGNRPMERVAEPLRLMGAQVETVSGRCPITVSGGDLHGIQYDLPVASAQVKSAILLAGIQAEGTTTVTEPVSTRDHTERMLALCGADIRKAEKAWSVNRSELTLPESFHVPADISSAAFFLCAACIIPGSFVTAEGVLLNPTRTGFLEVLERMRADIRIHVLEESPEPWGNVEARFSPDLTACEIDEDRIPSLVDEVPILALVATQARGMTVFRGARELRFKESDRLDAVREQLVIMGARITTDGDCLLIRGPTRLKAPQRLNSYGDHRMAMTLRLAALLADTEPAIDGEESTAISYPGFHETLKRLNQ